MTRPNGSVHPGTTSSRELEGEVDRTRAAMDRTLDAIAGKLTPQQLMMEAFGAFREGSSTLATKLVETARDHPVPATVIGLGIAMLLSESRSSGPDGSSRSSVDMLRDKASDAGTVASHGLHRVQDATSSAAEGVRESASQVAGAVRDRAADVSEKLRETGADVRERAGAVAGAVGDRASELSEQARLKAERMGHTLHSKADSMRETASRVPDQARERAHAAQLGFWQYMDRSPLAVGAAALAAGVATGLAVPRTGREDEWMGRKRDGLLEHAQGVRAEMMEKGKEIARTAADVARTEALRQGLTPGDLVQKLRNVTRETEQAVKTEAQRAMPDALKG